MGMYQKINIVYGIRTTRTVLKSMTVDFEGKAWSVMDYMMEFEDTWVIADQDKLPQNFHAVRQEGEEWAVIGMMVSDDKPETVDRIVVPGVVLIPNKSTMSLVTVDTLRRLGFTEEPRFYVVVTW